LINEQGVIDVKFVTFQLLPEQSPENVVSQSRLPQSLSRNSHHGYLLGNVFYNGCAGTYRYRFPDFDSVSDDRTSTYHRQIANLDKPGQNSPRSYMYTTPNLNMMLNGCIGIDQGGSSNPGSCLDHCSSCNKYSFRQTSAGAYPRMSVGNPGKNEPFPQKLFTPPKPSAVVPNTQNEYVGFEILRIQFLIP
jgi:hypothetical protein